MGTSGQSTRRRRLAVTVQIDETALKKAADALPSEREQYEQACQGPRAELQPLIDAVRESERLTQDDFAIRINARA